MGVFKKEKLAQIEKRREVAHQHGILVVDDENANLEMLFHLLKDEYDVFLARDGVQALEMMRDPEIARRVHLILCDHRMPKLSGIEVLERVIEIAPEVIRILLTGYIDIHATIEAINKAHIYKFMLKPFESHDLLLTIARALEAYELRKNLSEYHRGLEEAVRQRTKELEEANRALQMANQRLEQAGEEIRSSQEKLLHTVEQQKEAIRTLSTPIIEVWDGVLTVPVLGALDPERAAQMMDRLLAAIVSSSSHSVIIDLTGVETMDETIAATLIRLVSAVKLLGAQGIVTGIKGQAAQAIVALGMDLSKVITLRSLREALVLCMNQSKRR